MPLMSHSANGRRHAVINMSAPFVLGLTPFLNVLKDNTHMPIKTEIIPKACTPVKLEKMHHWLMLYPDREKAEVLIEGFSSGFKLPVFTGQGCVLVNNLKSVRMLSHVVREKLIKEIAAGRVAGPFVSPPFLNFRISPLGVVPKKEPNSYRLIHHLSYPKGGSLNDEIDDSLASVSYSSFDDAIRLVKRFGRGALLAKSDIKSAFRLLPIAPESFSSLGFCFEEKFFYDMCLPMGCSLSCRYFETFATFLQWVVTYESGCEGIIHYLDDFLFIGPPDSPICSLLLELFLNIAQHFGVPIATEKTIFPDTVIEFLGINIDTMQCQYQLPLVKIIRIQNLICSFLRRKKVLLKELQSFLGLLAFASRVMPVGRIFSRRLSLAMSGFKSPFSHIRITSELKDDLLVWSQFLSDYNGRTFFQEDFVFSADIDLYTDAAGAHGFAAIWSTHWCCGGWPPFWVANKATRNIVLLELFPIVVAFELWGNNFANKRILVNSDNKGVIFAINCLSSKSIFVIKLLRYFVLLCLKLNIWVKAKHVAGKSNLIADALSRFQMTRFRQLLPEADLVGYTCPSHLWDLI